MKLKTLIKIAAGMTLAIAVGYRVAENRPGIADKVINEIKDEALMYANQCGLEGYNEGLHFNENLEQLVKSPQEDISELERVGFIGNAKNESMASGIPKAVEAVSENVVMITQIRKREYTEGKRWETTKLSVGTLISPSYAIANMHVMGELSDSRRPAVLHNGILYGANVVASSKRHDLALFKLEQKINGIQPVKFVDEKSFSYGDALYMLPWVNTTALKYGYSSTGSLRAIGAVNVEKNIRKGRFERIRSYTDLSKWGRYNTCILKSDIPSVVFMSGSPAANADGYIAGIAVRGDETGTWAAPASAAYKLIGLYKGKLKEMRK